MAVPIFGSDQVNRWVLRKQHLPEPASDIGLAQTVEHVGGLHATAATVPYLSLWARRARFAKGDLQAALYDQRTVAKVLCMRNTLFILPEELLPTAYQATKKRRDPLIDRYLRHHGIDRQQYEHTCKVIKELLATSASTTAEMKDQLNDESLSIVVDLMPNDWQLVRGRPRGSWRSSLHEYSTFQAWFPHVDLGSRTPEEAQRELVQHYLASFGPATQDDIVWWIGLGKTEISRSLGALEEQVTGIGVEGLEGEYYLLTRDVHELESDRSEGRSLYMAPALDPYIMGYKDRRRFLPPQRHDQVFDRAGNALPTVWHDGQVIGVWLEDKKRTMVEVLLFEEAEEAVISRVEAEAQQLGLFLEHDPVNVRIRLYPDDLYPKTPFTMARRQ